MSIKHIIRRCLFCGAIAIAALLPSMAQAALSAPTPSGWCAYTSKSAYISWTAVSGAKSYAIFRGTSSTFSWSNKRLVTTTSTSYFDTTAVCGSTYYYWVCPNDGSYLYANTAGYVKIEMTGGACDDDCDLQPQPSGYADSNGRYAYLYWSAPSCYAPEAYAIYRGTSPTFSWSTIKRVATTTNLFYYDYTVQAGTTYYYWIGTSDGSYWTVTKSRYKQIVINGDIATAQAYGYDVKGSHVHVYWTKVSDSRVIDYAVYRGTSSTFSWTGCTKIGSTSNNYYNDYTAKAGTTYYYWIASGSSSKWYINKTKWVSVKHVDDTPVPPTPTASVNASDSYIKLSWSTVSGCTAGYAIFRSTSSTFSWNTRIAITYNTYYYDYTATPGVKYYYWIAPRTTQYTYANYSRYAYGIRSLTAPSAYGYTYTSGSSGYNYIGWSSVTGCTAGYYIYRSTSPTFSWSATRFGPVYSTSYYDYSASKGVTYYYWVAPRTSLYTYVDKAKYKSLKR